MNKTECAKRGCSYYWQDENESYPVATSSGWPIGTSRPVSTRTSPLSPKRTRTLSMSPMTLTATRASTPMRGASPGTAEAVLFLLVGAPSVVSPSCAPNLRPTDHYNIFSRICQESNLGKFYPEIYITRLYIPLHHTKVPKRLLKKLLFKKVLTFSALCLIINNVRRAQGNRYDNRTELVTQQIRQPY